jgi:hypothetical protein
MAKMPLTEHDNATWSRHSRRIEPIALSQYPFCHGDRGAVADPECSSPEGGG